MIFVSSLEGRVLVFLSLITHIQSFSIQFFFFWVIMAFGVSNKYLNIFLVTKKKKKKNKTRSIQRTQAPPRLWPWRVTLTWLQGQKAYVIRCRLLYYALVPGTMSMNVIVCEILLLIYFLWPLTFTCDLQLMSRSLSL